MSYTQPLCLSLLNRCKTLTSVKQIHANLIKSGHQSDHIIAGKLLLHCAVMLPDSLGHACSLFRHIPEPDRFMYNTLIRGLAEAERPQLSLVTFIELTRRRSVSPPDSFSFAFVLKAAANLRYLKAGIQLHSQALAHGLHAHIFVGTTLISMYGECGCSGLARKVFDEMAQPNVVAWNAVITACFRGGDVKAAAELFDSMPFKNLTSWNLMLAGYLKAGELELARKGFLEMPGKDEVSWSTMIVGLVHNERFEEAFGSFRELHSERKLRPNEASLTGVLLACALAGAFEFGQIIHGFIEKSGFAWIISVNNALLDTYSKCGNMGMARLVFERMPNQRNIVSWTSMIVTLAMHGYGNEAIEVFRKMEESGIRPDGVTFISLLYACSHAGLVEQGCGYFNKIRSVYNIEPAIEHYGCMVDLYSRAGQLFKAYEFVCQMPIPPNDIIWRTLLGACSIHGNVKLAEQVKEKLAELDPDNSGDHVLLSNIYAVAGKWKDVATVRRSMTRRKIQKSPGWSMIEVDKIIYTFVAGSKQDNIREEAYEKLKQIMLRLRIEGSYVPEVGGVLYDIEEEEKEDSLTTHSEKLALAFGIARMREGKTIKIVKNLRICRDCHAFFKLVSRIYNLEIVVRDRNRFHSFADGCCSCSDYW